MRYANVSPAEFLARENRFVAVVRRGGREIRVHVKNTGRCRELLVAGAPVWLVRSDNPDRKYAFDLVAVEKNGLLINMDSQAPNRVFGEFLRSGGLTDGVTSVRPEYRYGQSRMDFRFDRGAERHLAEVKGVTLEQDGVCRFPDAPTARGTRHLRELIAAAEEGWQCWICFVVQMEGMARLEPNRETDPEFSSALGAAKRAGVRVRAFGCRVEPDLLEIDRELPVVLDPNHIEL